MLNLTKNRVWYFLISAVVIVAGFISLFAFGLNQGIDFAGGLELTLKFEQTVATGDLKQELADQGYTAGVQRDAAGDFVIRTVRLSSEQKEQLKSALTARFGALTELGVVDVDTRTAEETARVSVIAVVVSSVAILLYLAWAYRQLPNPFRYGTCAIAALAHDVLVVLGVFSVGGVLFGWEINLIFVAGILAVIGYSDNAVVVVFDRIRENLKKGISPDFETVVNVSLIETLGRSLNTILTTLFAVVVVLIFVGGPIVSFVWALLIGIVTSMFSSVFIAPNLLVAWETGKWGRGKAETT